MEAMTHDPGDEDLRQLFADLRERDRRMVPGFDRVVARAHARPVRRTRAPLLVAAAAVLVLLAGAAGTLLLRHSTPTVALASWRSPTAFLLHGPGEDILRTVPSVSASVVRLEVEAAAGHNP
jgi:hypothetical protein